METNHEQLYHNLEQRYMTLHKDYENIYNENNLLKRKVTNLEDENLNLRNTATSMSFDTSKYESEIKLRDAKVRNLEYEIEKSHEDYKRKSDECDRLREDLKSQSNQVISYQSRLREIQAISSENESKLLPLQYELNTIKREKELLESRNKFLETELEQKSTEFYQTKRDHLTILQQIELQLAQKNNECGEYSEKIKQLEDHLSIQNEKIDQYLTQIHNLEENKNIQQNDFLKELTAQKKLADLYKQNLDESLKQIERLEDNFTSLSKSYAEQTQSNKTKFHELLANAQEKFQHLENEKNMKINELEKQLHELNQQKENNEINKSTSSLTNAICIHQNEEMYLPTEYELRGKGYTLTTMYSQAIQFEKELNDERLKKQELELYLDRILKDIDSKAPMIASFRRDHLRLIESHDQLTKKLDGIINENNKLKKRNNKLEKESTEHISESTRLNLMNADLCKQIQHLLTLHNNGQRHLTAEQQQTHQQLSTLLVQHQPTHAAAHDVISEYLVTYDTIEELQKRNIQLLSIVRKLSSEQEEKATNNGNGQSTIANQEEIQATLNHTLNELEMMRESRQRMEDMVTNLIQQRDFYRAMSEEIDGVSGNANGASKQRNSEGTSSTPSTPSRQSSSLKQIEALQIKLGEAEESLHKYQDRCTRLEHIEETLNVTLDKLRDECSNLRSQLVQSSASSQFHQNRMSSLESSLQSLQSSYELLSNKKSEMDGMLIIQQKSLQEKDNKISEISDQLRYQTEQTRRASLEREVLREQEKRFIEQITELKEEIKKHSQLSESMYRIETSLTSNLTNQNKKLEDEIEVLKNQIRNYEKSESEYKLITEQKLNTATDEIKLLMLNNHQKQNEINELKEVLIKEQNNSTVAHERAVILEKQLTIAQDRLNQFQSTNITHDMMINENNEKELTIEKQLLEIHKLENELKIMKDNVDQYKQINIQTERLFKEYQMKSTQTKQQLEEEKNECQNEINELKRELSEKKQQMVEIRRENESLHESFQNKTKETAIEIHEYQKELDRYKNIEGVFDLQINGLKSELSTIQIMLKEANNNYERELLQHSQTVQKCQDYENRYLSIQSNHNEIQMKLNEMTLKCLEYEKMLESNKSHSESTIVTLQEQLLNLKHTNDLLHNQVQIMSYEINKNTFQTIHHITSSEDSSGMKDGDSTATATTTTTESAILGTVGSSSSLSSSAGRDVSHEQTIIELRDVIKYMKREKDMLDAKYTICEMEKARYIHETMNLTKSLDEIKLELQREMNSKGKNALRSEEEIQILLNDVSQLNILRDSNVHLRNENLEKSQLIHTLNDKVAKLQQEMLPLNERILTLESHINILTSEKQSLLTDCNYWKDRLHQLISRYNDVDPEEHRILKEKLEKTEELSHAMTIETEELRKKLIDVERKFEETETQLKAVSNELNSAKATAETMEKTSENLRGKLREFNKQIQAQKTQLSQLTAASDTQKQKINEQENTIQKLQNDIAAAHSATQDATAQAASANLALANAQSQLSRQAQKPQEPLIETEAATTVTTAPIATIVTGGSAAQPPPQQPPSQPTQEIAPSTDKKNDLQSLREAAMRRMPNIKKKPAEGEADAPAAKKSRQNTPSVPATPATPAATPAMPATTPATPVPIPAPVVAPPVKCYYFSTPNGCRKGDSCRFSHAVDDPQAQPDEAIEEMTQQPESTPSGVADESPQLEFIDESPQEISKDMEIVNEDEDTVNVEEISSEQVNESVHEARISPPSDEMIEVPASKNTTPPPIPAPVAVTVAVPVTNPPAESTTIPPKQTAPNATFPFFSSFRNPINPVSTGENKTNPFANLSRGPFSTAASSTTTSTAETSPPETASLATTTTQEEKPTNPNPFTSPPTQKGFAQLGSGSITTPIAGASQNTPNASSTFKGFGGSLFRPPTSTTTPTLGKFGGGLFGKPSVVPPSVAPSSPTAVATPPSAPVTIKEMSSEQLPSNELSIHNPPTAPSVEEDHHNEGDMEEGEGENEVADTTEQSTTTTTEQSNVSLATKVTMTAEQRRLRFARLKQDNPKKKKGNQANQQSSQPPPSPNQGEGGSAQE